MTEYSEDFDAPVAYPAESLEGVLAGTLAGAGIAQIHVAETEKYPHLTYFFDGGREHRSAASSGSWSTRRATCPPTTSSPR